MSDGEEGGMRMSLKADEIQKAAEREYNEQMQLYPKPVVESFWREKIFNAEVMVLGANYVVKKGCASHSEAMVVAKAVCEDIKSEIKHAIFAVVMNYPKAKQRICC